ncbi:hypothetical protein EAE96_001258 [Botrytis aclada]|nr:hypothetical protein EAE96_001258 [Botrytis aclada]
MSLCILLFLLSLNGVLASMITPRASLPTVLAGPPNLQARQSRIVFSTCGFVDGNANQAFIAPTGSICRVDTANSIWGVCTTSVTDLSPADCGWVGRCVDTAFCSTGCGVSNVAGYITLRCSSASPFCQITSSSAGAGILFTSLACGSQPVRETVVRTASTTGPIPASPHLASSVAASSTENASSAAQATSDSSSLSNPNSVATSAPASASALASSTNTASESPGSSPGSSGSSESQPSDAASSSEASPRESIFTISGSLVTSFFGQTSTVGVTVSITTTASGISSPSPSDSTAPAPKNPPKYNPKALIGIVLGVIVFLLLIFTLIWIGKYRRAQKSKSSAPTAESPTNFFFSNLPEVMEPCAKTEGIHEMYDDHGELRELDIAGAVAGRTGRVSVRELAATHVVGGRRSGRRSAREMEGDMVWGRERGRISIKELDGGVFVRNGRRGDGMTQVFELDGQSYI